MAKRRIRKVRKNNYYSIISMVIGIILILLSLLSFSLRFVNFPQTININCGKLCNRFTLYSTFPTKTDNETFIQKIESSTIKLISPTETPTVAQRPIIFVKESYIVTLINKIRIQHGLQPLREISVLDKSAYLKAKDMNDNNYFSHTDSKGRFFTGFFEDAEFYGPVAENLARGYPEDQTVVDAWMNSPEHRKNILQPEAVYAGYAMIGEYQVFHFGASY